MRGCTIFSGKKPCRKSLTTGSPPWGSNVNCKLQMRAQDRGHVTFCGLRFPMKNLMLNISIVSRLTSPKLYLAPLNWFNAAHSHIFDIAGSKETGRLLLANSWFPSFGGGTTSDILQEAGNTKDNKELSTMSVCAGKIHGKVSLIKDIGTLS